MKNDKKRGFIPTINDLPASPPFDKLDVRHKDGDVTNNSVNNLEWVPKEEMNYRSVWEAPCDVYCYEADCVYDTIDMVSFELDVPCQDIYDCCIGALGSAKGFHFCFEKDMDEFIERFESIGNGKYKRCAIFAEYRHEENLVRFPSIRMASYALSIPEHKIREALEDPYMQINGWCFEYDEDV